MEVRNAGSLQGDIPLEAVCGAVLGKPSRRGKLLLLPFSGSGFPENSGQAGRKNESVSDSDHRLLGLGIHLKMTGRIFVYPAGTEPEKHTRVIFDLDNGTRIFFDDARKFGHMRVLTPRVLHQWAFWNCLGPEPLEIDANTFAERFINRGGTIKALLLDQRVIAGCGNIYADESLFRAGIRPDARQLQVGRLFRLHDALQAVLAEAIAACGSSIRDYRTAQGDVGAFQNCFNVYGRAGKSCIQCGTILQKCRIAGRTSVFCPHCQEL